jgi:hypothetical protein
MERQFDSYNPSLLDTEFGKVICSSYNKVRPQKRRFGGQNACQNQAFTSVGGFFMCEEHASDCKAMMNLGCGRWFHPTAKLFGNKMASVSVADVFHAQVQVCAPVYVDIDERYVVDAKKLKQPQMEWHGMTLVEQPAEWVRAVANGDPRPIQLPNSKQLQWVVEQEDVGSDVPVFWKRKTLERDYSCNGVEDYRVVYAMRL